jgi:hypothetical protein
MGGCSREPFALAAVSVDMYRALVLASCAAACVSGAPPSDNWGNDTDVKRLRELAPRK